METEGQRERGGALSRIGGSETWHLCAVKGQQNVPAK